MKILALSDQVLEQVYTVQVGERYPNVDLIVGCGDLPFYYLDFVVSVLDRPLLYVRGNHDQGPQYTAEGQVLTQVPGGTDLHGGCRMVNGLLFAGLEGCRRYLPQGALMYGEGEMWRQMSRLWPGLLRNYVRYGRFLDILITHAPPYGIHDRLDLAHTGFKAFLPFLRLCRPRYLLHGHIHRYNQNTPHITHYEQTTVINVYPLYLLWVDESMGR